MHYMHILTKVEFEWDATKRERNIRDHGVDFREAREAFADRHAFVLFDGRHSLTEERFFLLGKTAAGQLLQDSHHFVTPGEPSGGYRL